MTAGRWKVVSTAPLPAEIVRGFFPADADVDVVVVDPRTEDAAAKAVADADIVLGDYSFEVPISRKVIEAMTRCRLIQQPSAGYQQIDVEAAAEHGIPVANTGGANAVAVAEHTVLAALALMKQLVWCDAEVRAGRWPQHDVVSRGHVELAGKSWGIVGFGRIGREVARRLVGWDVAVRYFDVVRPPAAVEEELGAVYADLDELLRESDVVSLHAPLTDDTRRLVDAAVLERMKPDSYLVNVARGELVDEEALAEALRQHRIRGAALDVFGAEPLPPAHPFTELDNVILTPHTAGTPVEARGRIINEAIANLHRVVAGEPPENVVNGVLPSSA